METLDSRASLSDIEALYWSDRPRARSRALARLERLDSDGSGSASRRLGLVIASVDHLQGDAAQGATYAQQAFDWAVAHGDVGVQARCHRYLSAVFRRVGESGLSLEHAVSANDLLDDSEPPYIHAAARLCLGDALGSAGSYDESQRRYREALHLMGDDDLPIMRLAILNNSAFTYHVAHQANDALAAVDLLLRTSAAHHLTLGMSERDTVVRQCSTDRGSCGLRSRNRSAPGPDTPERVVRRNIWWAPSERSTLAHVTSACKRGATGT